MIAISAQTTNIPSNSHVKITASGVSTSAAQILSILKRIFKRNLRVANQADTKSAQYQRVVQFEPSINQNVYLKNSSNLIEGISELLNTMQKHIASGA